MSHQDITKLLLAVSVLLASARIFGEIARRFRQPAVLGEILAGIILGPTVFGSIYPDGIGALFPQKGTVFIGLQSLSTIAVCMFLLVAGMEVDLSTIWRQGKSAISISIGGLLIPFSLGFLAGWFVPRWVGAEPDADRMVFALFFATALSISALPVIAKTLLDLNLFRTDMGMMVIAAAIVDDLLGWMVFAVILGMISGSNGEHPHVIRTLVMVVGYAGAILTVGRWLIDRILPWLQAHTSWPGGVLGFALSGALLSAAITEWMGVHAVFGAFLFGVALGDSRHLREQTRAMLDQFISFVFAPIFFASIGLKVNFAQHFDFLLIVVVLVIATVGKVLGCGFGARLSGLSKGESWAVGFGMNARGAMEIILGLLALQYGVINERMFVALVVMALVTSMTSGYFMEKFLNRKKTIRFSDFLTAKTFKKQVEATERRAAIDELCRMVCQAGKLPEDAVKEAVWQREEIFPTGIGNGVAIPHARIDGLKQPILGVGLASPGVDFDAPDGKPARLIFLILTPKDDPESQLSILADIGKTFQAEDTVERATRVENYTELLAHVNSASR